MQRLLCVLGMISWLMGCAPEVYRTQVPFTPASNQPQRSVLRIRESMTVMLPTGYARLIKQGSVWRFVGTTPYGEVFRPVDEVFTIVGANTHEAYLVVTAGRLVGFYLPGEGAFSPLPNTLPLQTE